MVHDVALSAYCHVNFYDVAHVFLDFCKQIIKIKNHEQNTFMLLSIFN